MRMIWEVRQSGGSCPCVARFRATAYIHIILKIIKKETSKPLEVSFYYAVSTPLEILALFKSTELVTTDNELKAIANPANSGLSVNPMA